MASSRQVQVYLEGLIAGTVGPMDQVPIFQWLF